MPLLSFNNILDIFGFIEDLQKMDAVEALTEHNISIPQWQIDKVREAVKYAEENPSTLMDWEPVKQNIKSR